MKNSVSIFSAIVLCFALYFSYHMVVGTKLFLQATAKTSAIAITFHAKEGTFSRFYLEGDYTFEYRDSKFAGKTTLSHPFLNELFAKEEALKAEKKIWQVHFNPGNPNWSTLEPHLPFKEIFSALLLWISLGYLFMLQRKM